MSHTRTRYIAFPTDAKPSRLTALRNDCGKVFYDSRADARRAVKSMRSRGKGEVPGKQLGEYRCPGCGRWHVGHSRI